MVRSLTAGGRLGWFVAGVPLVLKTGQDLILAAMNDAHRKADEAMSKQMQGMMGGMKIPGLF